MQQRRESMQTLCAATIVMTVASAAAAETVLTFDALGLPDGTIITDQYAAFGITFFAPGGSARLITATNPIFPMEPQALYSDFGSAFIGPIVADIDPGATMAGAWIDMGFMDAGIMIEAFDGPGGTGNLLGLDSTVIDESFIAVSAPNIRSVVFSQVDPIWDTPYLIDNFTFQHFGGPCSWDLDGDGAAGITDLLILLAQWGTDPGGPPDFDGDGNVGITDFLELLANWGPCPFFADCNGNGVWDLLDLENGTSQDCNGNGIPDECDIAEGTSPDFNGNGIPDECEPAPNDECEDAIVISDGATPFLTFGATTGGPPAICEDFFTFVNDIWFLYTPPCTGIATFSLCNDAEFDTLLALYFAGICPPPLNPLACSDNADGCGQTSEIQQVVVEGIPYLVRVGGTEGGGVGVLTVSCEP